MPDPIDVIRQFLDGTLPPPAFRDILYEDDRFETLLANDSKLPSEHYVRRYGGTYCFLLSQDYDDPGGVLSAHGALAQFMERNAIPYSKSNKYADSCDLVLDAAPGWLNPNHKYVAEKIMPDADDRSGGNLRSWLAQRLLEVYRCAGDPPQWIQSPSWPVNANGPLVFLGQIDIPDYFHDTAAAYVFHDPITGACETIIQVA